MPRKSYYKPYRRNYPKKKWASNIKQGTLGGSNVSYATLVENSTAGSTPTPVIVKCGNFRIQGDVTTTGTSGIGQIYIFVIFMPEGLGGSDLGNAITSHPEWVLAWTAVDVALHTGSSGTLAAGKFSISTRLKRNLNSGDKVYLYLQSGSGPSAQATYTAQYFTCAN